MRRGRGPGAQVGPIPSTSVTTSRTSSVRTALLGLVAGLVLLALVGGFAIGLPKVEGDESTGATASSVPALPDTLSNGLRAVELVAAEEAKGSGDTATQAQDFLSRQKAISGSAVEALEKQYDAPVALRAYQGENAQAQTQLTITVIGAPAGPFLPQGPVPDPKSYGVERGAYSLVDIGDGRCSLAWSQPVPQGQQVDPAEVPSSVYCQVGAGGRTYLAIGNGFTGEQVVKVLDDLARA